jgi:hypothetical protein
MSRQPTPSKDDVAKLTRGKPSKSRTGSRHVRHRLRLDEQERLEIARTRGFLLVTPGTRTALRNAWWLDCQARQRPCVYVERTEAGLAVSGMNGTAPIKTSVASFDELLGFLQSICGLESPRST